jgi:hypothetical protein
MSVLGRNESTCRNYGQHVASMALHFGKVPTELDVEQVQEYLFLLQNALKHLLKPTLSTVFMDLDSYLNPKGSLMSTYIYLR